MNWRVVLDDVYMHCEFPVMLPCGIAVFGMSLRAHKGRRELQRLLFYIPRLDYPAGSREAAERIRVILGRAMDQVGTAYMATTRGLPA